MDVEQFLACACPSLDRALGLAVRYAYAVNVLRDYHGSCSMSSGWPAYAGRFTLAPEQIRRSIFQIVEFTLVKPKAALQVPALQVPPRTICRCVTSYKTQPSHSPSREKPGRGLSADLMIKQVASATTGDWLDSVAEVFRKAGQPHTSIFRRRYSLLGSIAKAPRDRFEN